MQRMSWRTAIEASLSSLMLWGGVSLAFTTVPEAFSVSQIRGQEPVPKVQPGVPRAPQPAAGVNPSTTPVGAKSNPTGPEVVKPTATPRPLPKLSQRQTEMLKQSSTARMQAFRDAIDAANASTLTCKEAFDRGLMPLPDFAEQAAANLEIRLVVADLQGDRMSRVKALSDHLDLMKMAAKQLQDFNQPASQGWAADTAYAKLLASNAELRLAAARGDQAAYEAAVELSRNLAETQFTERLADFQSGQASLPLLAASASYLTTKSGLPADNREKAAGPTKYDEYLQALDDVVVQTQKFARQGAGVGREDRLYQAQFELAKADGRAALQKRNPEMAAAAFDQAADSAQDWFESEMKFYQTGTASLRDITQAWWGRAELTDRSERAGLIADTATQDKTAADLERIQKLVANTQDRQGRIAADIAYVNTLDKLDNLWARQRAVQAMAAAKGVTPGKSSESNRGSRVIEINPKSSTPSNSKTIPGTTPTDSQKSKNSTIEIVTPKRTPN